MKNCIFRHARRDDLVDIINIWIEAFGDAPDLPRRLLLDCGLLKNALVAECDGTAVSSLLLYPGLKLGEYSACYLYALCTRPDYSGRGIGRALTAYAADSARGLGCDLLLLQPGDDDLEHWYARIGFRTLWRSSWKSLDISGVSAPDGIRIDADKFLSLLHPCHTASPELMVSENIIHEVYGGAFLCVEKSLLCTEFDGIILHIRCADCDAGALPRAAAAAAKYFGTEHVSLLVRDDHCGSIALMGLPLRGELPELPRELFFPFTLD